MILAFYLLLLTFKMTATLSCAVYCVRISRIKLVPTFTWMLFATGFFLRFLTQFQGFIYTNNILGIWQGFNIWLVILNQAIEVVIVACFLIGFARTYYAIQSSKFVQH